MARITPKTNWVASDIPVATDFNRIENNSEQAFDELDAEVAARIADVDAEEAARIAADNALRNPDVGAIGSYALLRHLGDSQVLPGSIINASLLVYASCGGSNDAGLTPSGAWRCMGFCSSSVASSSNRTTLFMRVS